METVFKLFKPKLSLYYVLFLVSFALSFSMVFFISIDNYNLTQIYMLSALVFIFLLMFFKHLKGRNQSFIRAPLGSLILPLLVFVGFQVGMRFVGGQDARAEFLPLARFIATNHRLPSLYNLNFNVWRLGYPPLVWCWGGTLFKIFGAKSYIAALVPFFAFIFFMITLMKWAKEMRIDTTIISVLILLSPFAIDRFSWFYEECLFTFSTTFIFYQLWRSWNNFDDELSEFFTIIACGLALISKYSGIAFLIYLTVMLICKRRKVSFKSVMIMILVFLPAAMWYVRNILLLKSPLFPFLNFLVTDQNTKTKILDFLKAGAENISIQGGIKSALLNQALFPLPLIWLILEVVNYFKKKEYFFIYTLIFFVVYMFGLIISAYTATDMRYLMPFWGVAVMRIAYFINDSINNNKNFNNFWVKNKIRIVTTVAIFLIPFSFFWADYIFEKQVTPFLKTLAFFRNKGYENPIRIFVDTDQGFRWYGQWIVFEPLQLGFANDYLQVKNG